MRLLVYCILGAPGPEAALPEGVSLVEAGGLAAAVSRIEKAPPPEAEQVLAFEAVVEWFHERWRAVIPVRFGSVFEDAAAVGESLERGAAEYRRKLEALEDAVEIGIRVQVKAPAPAEHAGSGTAWLDERRESYRALDRLSEELKRELAGLFRRTCEERSAGQLSMCFLVPRDEAAAFLNRCTRLEKAVVVSGPWPPYNFAGG